MIECDSGFTNWGDYSLESPDCLIDSLAVRVLSYFLIILPSITNILIIWHFISIGIKKKRWYIISRDYKTLFPLSFLIMGIFDVIGGVLKISYPDGREQPLIGRDLSITLVTVITYFFTFLGAVLYLQVIIQFLRGYTRIMNKNSSERVLKRLRKMSIYSWFIIPAITISSILLLIALGYPSISKELCMAHLICIAITAFAYGLIFVNCLSLLTQQLNNYIHSVDASLSEDLKRVVSRLNVVYFWVIGMCSGGGMIYIIFASSNYLFRLWTYLHHVIFIIVPTGSYVLVLTVAGVSRSDKKQNISITSDNKIVTFSAIQASKSRSRSSKIVLQCAA